MKTVILDIGGMTCGGCVQSVAKVLTALDGVAGADVALEEKTAVVVFDPAQVQTAQLIEAVEDAGFDAAVRMPV